MEINFDRLRQLSTSEYKQDGTAAKKPTETPPELIFSDKQYKSTPDTKKAIQGEFEQNRATGTYLHEIRQEEQAIKQLQRKADNNANELERAAAVSRKYQENIKSAGQQISEIVKGLNAGQDIYDLFLKAVKVISCMTSDTVLYNHAEKKLKILYGKALGEYKPLKVELEEIAEKIELLEESYLWADTPAEKEQIETALSWNRQRQSEIEKELYKDGAQL